MRKSVALKAGLAIALSALIIVGSTGSSLASTEASTASRRYDPPGTTNRMGPYPFAPYDFLFRKPNGSPVAYNRCLAHPVQINPTNATPEMIAATQAVISDLARATGLNLYYAGSSQVSFESPFRLKGALQQPIVVSFETRVTVPRLQGEVIGIGMSRMLTKKKYRQLAAGRLVIDVEDYTTFTQIPELAPSAARVLRATLLHEFGHVLGLAHVSDPTSLMYPSQTEDVFEFSPNDLAGLSLLGSQPCGPAKAKQVKKRHPRPRR